MRWAEERARAVLGAMDGAFAGDGIVVAVAALDREGPVIVTTEGLPPDARFEIGSVTKTMTATLLAVLALEGALTLDDPAGRWLDAGQNADITLGQLATHTSGLPREAPNHAADGPNPYRAFTAERAEEGLRAVARKPGGGRAYSSFGYQLLGLVLERAAGRPYQDLLADLLLGPLGMTCSGVGAAGGGTRLTGHAGGRPADHWDRALPGAGGVEASVGDLAIYLAAGLAPPPGRLGDAIAMCLRPRVPIDAELAGGLGWMIGRGQGVCSHNGGTGGFSASTALRPESGQAIGALLNTSFRSAPLLDGAVLAALADGDAGRLRPAPTGDAPGPEWETRARQTAQALLDGRFADVHASRRPEGRAVTNAEQLADLWGSAMRWAGGPARVSAVSCRTVPGGVGALVSLDGARRPVSVLLTYNEAGQIAMLRLLSPDESAPW
jgi:CubicO group peptidase (beta-lactamase class C family)